MTTDDIPRLILTSLLTAGFISVLLNSFLGDRAERRKRRVEFLMKQLQGLYGPLDLFTGQNQQLTVLREKIEAAYKKEYEREWSDDEATQKSIDEQTSKTIDKMNEYGRRMKENNLKMVEILGKNYDLIDSGDAQIFQDFMTACVRDEIEFGSGRLDIPLRIARHLGLIIIYDPTFVNRIRTRCEEKRAELTEARRISNWAWPRIGKKVKVAQPDASVPAGESSPNADTRASGSSPR